MMHALSFWYSLLFLIVRAYGVCLYSSSINTEARKPIGILRTLPSHTWCIEVICISLITALIKTCIILA